MTTDKGVHPRSHQLNFDRWSSFNTLQEVARDINDWTDAAGNPILAPVSDRHPGWQRYTNWNDLGPWGKQLRGRQTKIVYLSPDGHRMWNLAGDWGGKEGVVLDQRLQGTTGVHFEQRYSTGAYTLGDELERTDYGKRVINMGVLIGPAINFLARKRFPDNEFAFRMLDERWWDDWPENSKYAAGFMGEFTRTHGWRWIRPRYGEANMQTLEQDAVAYGNNVASWSMTIHDPSPFYSKQPWIRTWHNDDLNAQINGRNHGVIQVANRGDWDQFPKFIVEGAGYVSIQDGVTDRMVPLAKIQQTDGMILVDTDPSKRTLTGEFDPVDNVLYKMIRNSQILDYLLGDLTKADSGIPVGRRMPGGIGFTSSIPAKSNAHIKVTHSNPRGKITAVVSQWYKRGSA